MKIVAVVLNVVMFLFTCMVLATDGMSARAIYVAFSLLLLAVPVVNAVVLLGAAGGTGIRRAAVVGNVVLVAAVVLAFVDQYPHPEEAGFVEYMIAVLLTPIVSVWALLRGGRGRRPQEAAAKIEALP